MIIPDGWTPTAENINALPEPVRRYIHDLETNADPAGNLQRLAHLEQENAALRKRLAGAQGADIPAFATCDIRGFEAMEMIRHLERGPGLLVVGYHDSDRRLKVEQGSFFGEAIADLMAIEESAPKLGDVRTASAFDMVGKGDPSGHLRGSWGKNRKRRRS